MVNKPSGTTPPTVRFARKLQEVRLAKGWSQSDLARRVWGTETDSRGYAVAKNRDRISAWESGKQQPSRDNLEKLSEVLGLPVEQLAPDVVSAAVHRSKPAIGMTMVEGRPDQVVLEVNTVVSLSTAAKVIAILEHEFPTSEH